MNRKSLGLLSWLLAVVTLATPDEVRADSDGYYCVGPDYIAYQLRGWQWFNRGEHRLTIVHFDAKGIRFSGEIVLGEDFQPHAMHCEADFVRIEGWGRSYLQVEVRLDSDMGPVLTSTVYDEARVFDGADFPALLPNLGDWSQPGVSIIAERGYHDRASDRA